MLRNIPTRVYLAIAAVASPFCSPLVARELPVADAEQLETAIASAQPGDVLILADGTWANTEILFRAQGTPEAPITLRAHTPGMVQLTGESSLRFVGQYLVADGLLFANGGIESGHVVAFRGDSDEPASHCRLTNTAIVDYNIPNSAGTSSNWVSLYGTHNRVDHCLFSGKNTRSPLLTVWLDGQSNHHRIDSNYFRKIPPLGKNGGETMRVGDSKTSMTVSATIVEDNYFEECDGEVEIISNKSCENIYRANTFVRCAGALTLRHGNRCLVEGNYFLGENKHDTGGIRVIGEDHRIYNNYLADLAGEGFHAALTFVAGIPNPELSSYYQIKRTTVAFNTIVNCQQSVIFGLGAGERGRIQPMEDCVFANNVISSTATPIASVLAAPVRTTFEGNIFHGAESGLADSTGVSTADPLLERKDNGLFIPAENSPLRNSAAGSFPDVTTDISGVARGEKKDAGCFQYAESAIERPRPLNASNVGPAWMTSSAHASR
jgi:poly(beta-D-mannuronate) lyase